MLWVNEQLSICLIFLRLVRMLLTNIHFYCGKCIKVSVKYLISMFKWTLAASMFWSSQILKGEFHWLSCDTVQRGETKRMLRCCNIGKLFISFLDQRWNLTCLSISSLSIIEATFKAQSIQEFNVLPEVAKILKNLLRLEKECRLTDCKGTMCEIFACSAYCLLQYCLELKQLKEVQKWQNSHEDWVYVARSTVVWAELPRHEESGSKGLEVIVLGNCAYKWCAVWQGNYIVLKRNNFKLEAG